LGVERCGGEGYDGGDAAGVHVEFLAGTECFAATDNFIAVEAVLA
jgi:hypothetical protein